MNYLEIDTPVGRLRLVSDGKQLTAIELTPGESDLVDSDDPVLAECARQLLEYFAGRIRRVVALTGNLDLAKLDGRT